MLATQQSLCSKQITQFSKIDFLYKMKLRGKIVSKINYEKRKSKILTSLAFKFQKIQLRNYFIKYWANVKSTRIDEQREAVI